MPQKPPHPWDGIAEEVGTWLEKESKWYADALVGNYQVPFSADVSQADTLDYYKRQFYTAKPDGSLDYNQPNTQGREALIKRVGIDQYAEIAKQVKGGTAQDHQDTGRQDSTAPMQGEE